MLTQKAVLPLPAFSTSSLDLPRVSRYLHYYQLDFKQQGLCDQQAFGGIDCDQYHIAAHHFAVKQAKGTVLYLHGYLDHIGSHHKIIRDFLDQQFNVISFDLPGHGLSSGIPAAIDHFDDYQQTLKWVLQSLQPLISSPLHIMGHSTGAAIAMHYVFTTKNQPFKSQILLAPLVEPCRFNLIKLGLRFVPYFTQTIQRDFSTTTQDPKAHFFIQYQDSLQCQKIHISWLQALRKWQQQFNAFTQITTPTLMIQAEADQTVNWKKNSAKIAAKCIQLEPKIIKKAKHHLPLEADSYYSQVVSTLKLFLKNQSTI